MIYINNISYKEFSQQAIEYTNHSPETVITNAIPYNKKRIYNLFRILSSKIKTLNGSKNFQEHLILKYFNITNNNKELISNYKAFNASLDGEIAFDGIGNTLHCFDSNFSLRLNSPFLMSIVELQKTINELDFIDVTKKRIGLLKETREDIKNQIFNFLAFSSHFKSFLELIDENVLNIGVQVVIQTYISCLNTTLKKSTSDEFNDELKDFNKNTYKYIFCDTYAIKLGQNIQNMLFNYIYKKKVITYKLIQKDWLDIFDSLPSEYLDHASKKKIMSKTKFNKENYNANDIEEDNKFYYSLPIKLQLSLHEKLFDVTFNNISYESKQNLYNTFLLLLLKEIILECEKSKDFFLHYKQILQKLCHVESFTHSTFIILQNKLDYKLKRLAAELSSPVINWLIEHKSFSIEIKKFPTKNKKKKLYKLLKLTNKVLFFNSTTQLPLFAPIARILETNMQIYFPQSKKLITAVKKYCKSKEFNIFNVHSGDITYDYIPYIMKSVVKKNFIKKAYRVNYRTNQIDYRKLSNCFVANYVQHHDALLAQYFIKNILALALDDKYEIPLWTLHDRFGAHPFFCQLLKPTLLQSYKDLYKKNRFDEHFKQFNEILKLKVNFSDPNYLNENDINHPLFVKP